MSSKVNKLIRKWTCFGGTTPTSAEDEVQESLRKNQPKIIVTGCNSVGTTSPTFSHQSSSSNSNQSDGERVVKDIYLKTEEEEHKMGMAILIRSTSFDETDGGGATNNVSLVQVTDVEIGSFAHGFGIRKDDIVAKVNGRECSNMSLDIKEAFLCTNSENLQMEILRKARNENSGETEFLKMTLSRHAGTTTEEVEIITITRSNWSLADTNTYLRQDEREALLQFESENMPWVVPDNKNLVLKTNLSEDQAETDAKFRIHSYWCYNMVDTELPVVLQHVASGLCVALVDNSIRLVEQRDLEEVKNQSIIFSKRVPCDNFGPQVTFQSVLDKSCYIGFNTQSNGRAYDQAVPINIGQNGSTLEVKERNVVFLEI